MGKRRNTPGTAQLGLELDATLLARWKDYVKERGETLREAAERAFVRDMANPPAPVPFPMLPPLTVPTPGATIPTGKTKGRGREK